ncbi:lysophospholipid acyltransferase family protein [Brevifollis gellanilyticus]|uniref:Hemolysin n=1 Tax=Brevifollis gellanilyticus TaxID=748831 RepID=A0A512M696_9BACT|nr:GNAT family N-acyltransferase [Brevifollis gellanilyticus]GEP42265.1 hemolysin [Brevifollis gellanilyticus]
MIFDLSEQFRTPIQRTLYRAFGPLVERALGLRNLDNHYQAGQRHYHSLPPEEQTCGAFFDGVVSSVGARCEVNEPGGFEFPKTGPLVIIANHPFGILDPCLLAQYVGKHRRDLKVMTNSLLGAMPEVSEHAILVNPFGGKEAVKENLAGMKAALIHLKKGGALLIFPSGEVAAYKPGKGIEEAPWTSHVGSLVRRTQSSVLPVFFPGSNSTLFQAAGVLHPRLRTGLLLREFNRQNGSDVEMIVGSTIPFGKLRKFEDDEALTKYLRLHTLVLEERHRIAQEAEGNATPEETVALMRAASQKERIVREVEALRARGKCLVGQGGLSVFTAHSHEIPDTLQEIGRLREVTFRQVGEGTGQDIDLDKFDRYYEHLFLWDEARLCIAGAYRLGRADIILREYGPKGLYTNTLFRFEKPFLANLETAVEMGRSFITKDYQRNLSSLPLLWKGIAHWIARNPGYKKLFGPVSISKDYDKLSRKFIVEFLQENCLHENLASFVKPRNPFRYLRGRKLMREFISAELQDVDDCSALISSLETDGKGIPVLLKHYLRLNGTILSFNVDKEFSSVVDGLILVDLTETEPKLLAKYMGEEKCQAYLARHREASAPAPAAQ